MRVLPLFEDNEVRPLVQALAEEHRLDADLLVDLCKLELDRSGQGRADGINADIGDALDRCLKRIGGE